MQAVQEDVQLARRGQDTMGRLSHSSVVVALVAVLSVLATSALISAGVATAAVNDAYSQAVMAAGPVGYWRLGDTGGVATDELGADPGSLNGGVTTGVPGAIGGSTDTATRFDGTSGYVSLGSSAALQPQQFTIETWFRSLGQPNAPGYLARWRTFGWSAVMSQRGTINGTVYGTSGTQYVAESPGRYDDAQWHHLVVSRDAASLTLVIDGVQVASVAVPEATRYESGAAAIGRDGNANDWYFNGDIDEVAFYSRPLSLSEAIAHYCLGGGTGAVCNHPPIASAGADQTVPEGSTVTLDGSGSSDPDGNPLTYSWQLLDTTGPAIALANATSAQTTFSANDDGVSHFRLTVGDGLTTSTADTTVTVTNVAPTVSVSADPSAPPGTAEVTATFDDPGPLDTHTVTFNWGDGSTPDVVPVPDPLHGEASLSHTYTTPGDYPVQVNVTDNNGGSTTTGLTVTVAPVPPIASAGADQTVPEGSTVTLDGSGSSDPDGNPLTYSWQLL
ncbi:MAG TPA: PKD domain-containing protein, partial [Acidimicrobiia bacterium]|nr:PKD domain-containing protein [Acidimicrobiia bacterium]